MALLVQRATGALARTTLFLGITWYLFVSTARSSPARAYWPTSAVHSFVDLRAVGHLLSFLFCVLIGGYGAWALRSNAFRRRESTSPAGPQVRAVAGMLAFAIMGVLTMAGTSAPLLSKSSRARPGTCRLVHEHVNGPLGLLVCLLVAIGAARALAAGGTGRLFQQAAARHSLRVGCRDVAYCSHALALNLALVTCACSRSSPT